MTIGNADGTGSYGAPAPNVAEGSVAGCDGAGFAKYPVEGFFIGTSDNGAGARLVSPASPPRLYQSSGYQTSGWCQECGRRRGADGRCANCDPWWTSPLLMVGLPCVAATCFGLFLLVTALGGKRPVTVAAAAPVSSSAPVFSAYASPGSPVQMASALPAPPPVFSVPALAAAPGPVANLGPLPTAQDRFLRRYAEQESLRQTASFVDSAISADATAREQAEAQGRDAYFSPAQPSATSGTPSPSFPAATQMRMNAAPFMDRASM